MTSHPSDPTGDEPPFLVEDDDGSPIGVFDADQITTDGVTLAFAMAACCEDRDALLRVQRDCLDRVGSAGYGYVAANALAVMAEHILSPALDVTAAHGTDLRSGIQRIASGENPR